jgi:hypothetical protein
MHKTKKASIIVNQGETGYSLVLVLVMMMVGSLIIAPLLGYISTGLRTGRVFEGKTTQLYAADAGIEDGYWQIKYEHLATTLVGYSPYNYTSTWNYNLPETVNDCLVNNTIQNVWIPQGLTPPDSADAQRIIEGIPPATSPKVIVTGSVSALNTFEIKLQYYPSEGDVMTVNQIGVWLPTGFHYDTESTSNLDAYCDEPAISAHDGGEAIIWTLDDYPFAGDEESSPTMDPFPGVNPEDTPMVSKITFQFTGPVDLNPAAVAWINTNLDLTQGGSEAITYAWDADTRIYHITAKADTVEIDAYLAGTGIRELGSAVSGDYKAIGNSLMLDTNGDKRRETLLSSSGATVSDIPADAIVKAAYLYWSGWILPTPPFNDTCSNFGNWISGSAWNIAGGGGDKYFKSHYSSGAEATKYNTMKKEINLSEYTDAGEKVIVSWEQWENGDLENTDRLYFAFSGDKGNTWSANILAFQDDIGSSRKTFKYEVPVEYRTGQFLLRFYIMGFQDTGPDEEACLDNIQVIVESPAVCADTSATFYIDGEQVYFEDGVPTKGTGTLEEDTCQIMPNITGGKPNGYSYSSKKNVTELVKAFSAKSPNPATNHPGNGTYTVGDVYATSTANNEWAYAGWSLVIIYSSAETKGHQLYLYDTFSYCDNDQNLDFDHDGQPGGTISGFLVPTPVTGETIAAKLTAFVGEGDVWYTGDYLAFKGTTLPDGTGDINNVWNGMSLGMSAEGVDVDTFYITWASHLLSPGDTSAHIDMQTGIDSWNLVYIIISFRSETTIGNDLSYLIRG